MLKRLNCTPRYSVDLYTFRVFLCSHTHARTNFLCPKAGMTNFGTSPPLTRKIANFSLYTRANKTCQENLVKDNNRANNEREARRVKLIVEKQEIFNVWKML